MNGSRKRRYKYVFTSAGYAAASLWLMTGQTAYAALATILFRIADGL